MADHIPRMLTPRAIEEADLILLMDRSLRRLLPQQLFEEAEEKIFLFKPFFGLEGDIEDPYPDHLDEESLARYTECFLELREILEGNLDRLVESLRQS